MALYRNETTANGLRCEVFRPGPGGDYHVVFEREFAGIEQIEAIDWTRPEWGGDVSQIPAGYGFEVSAIDYDHRLQTYTVRLRVQSQYLGDVTGYQAEIRRLEEDLETAQAETEAARQELQTNAAELETAYTEGVNASDE